jgi:hypothetical protein
MDAYAYVFKTQLNSTQLYGFVRSLQETHYVSATEISRLILFKETVAVYCKNHTEHSNTFC